VVVAGNWRIVAVNGRATPRSTRYNLRLGSHGEAQFGCNIGSGSYRASPGRLTPTSDWIITSAGCPGDEWKWFDRRGWPVMTRPTIVELRGRGLRLRNELGSFDRER
jgi:heat shock protein HslJ